MLLLWMHVVRSHTRGGFEALYRSLQVLSYKKNITTFSLLPHFLMSPQHAIVFSTWLLHHMHEVSYKENHNSSHLQRGDSLKPRHVSTFKAAKVFVTNRRLPASTCGAPQRSPACLITTGQGLTFTSAHVLVSSTYRWAKHKKDYTQCVVRALMSILPVYQPHVCHRQGTGLSP